MHNKALLDRALKRLPDEIVAIALPPLDIGAPGEVVARQLRLDHKLLCVLACNLNFSPEEDAVQVFPQEELMYGIHGGALETSLMLHLKPDLVDLSAAKDFASRA